MTQNDQQTVLSGAEASQGIQNGHVRYVLGISLALCGVAGLVLWAFFTG
jgi:hypothetical protein